MTLSERLVEYVSAGFSGIWIQSFEHEDALAEIAGLCRERRWSFESWDIDQGLAVAGHSSDITPSAGAGADPLAAIRSANSMASPDSSAVVVLKNFHRFLGSAEVVQALDHQIAAGKRQGVFFVVLSPIVQIPAELEKLFVIIEHELPDREQLEAIARSIATEEGDLPTGAELETVLEAAGGLTRYEAEGAYSLSLVRHGTITAPVLWELKSQMLKKSGLLSLYRGEETFADLGGLEAMKQFCLRALRRRSDQHPEARPRGLLLLSPPGCGKSAFCKALGKETGRPTLLLDVGSLMGGLVGATEENTRRALRIIDAMSPCVILLDEVDKALSGVSGPNGDSGVSSRMFGTILSWMNDRTSDSFVVCTANDVSKLPPEFSRAERLDGCFFLDLPSRPQKDAIWQLYLQKFQLDREQQIPADEEWTGAEIKACCRLAKLLDVPLIEAAGNIVPVAVTSAESVERLRQWASCRCLSADEPGLFNRVSANQHRQGRRVSRPA